MKWKLIWTRKQRKNFPSEQARHRGGTSTGLYVLFMSPVNSPLMSASQIKNINRRLENIAKEASEELDCVCEHELWRNLGFDAIDSLEDDSNRAKANYYYGQWQTAKEVQEALG